MTSRYTTIFYGCFGSGELQSVTMARMSGNQGLVPGEIRGEREIPLRKEEYEIHFNVKLDVVRHLQDSKGKNRSLFSFE